jgi:uncharacterized membrane protein YozB (DUF420 family)
LTILVAAHPLVHINATLNAIATVLLIVGLYFIKHGRVAAHKRTMLTAFGVSIAFLVCYLWYHAQVGSVRFTYTGPIRYIYYAILATHVMLAATVPFLAVRQIYLGFRAIGCCRPAEADAEQIAAMAVYLRKHRRLARITYPIWLYVSVTGVAVYVMLYHLWPPTSQ